MTSPIYLDYAAGTPVDTDVLKAGLEIARTHPYNPSALYDGAVRASRYLNDCRARLGEILAVKADNLIFTAGATEANNLLILALRKTYPDSQLAGLAIDHDSWKLNLDYALEVDSRTAQVTEAEILKTPENICCLSLAGINNELGVIQPFNLVKKSLERVRADRRRAGNRLPLWLHIDASQMALVHNVQPQALAGADFVTLNGAKFYAFKQSGLLYAGSRQALKLPFKGGGQESGWRPGGESLLLAAGLAEALTKVDVQRPDQNKRLSALQKWFEDGLEELGGEVVLKNGSKSPHITNVVFAGADNERLAMQLSDLKIYVGIGSACHSQTNSWQASPLRALGYGEAQIYGALRFSFGYETEKRQLAVVLKHLKELLKDA